MERKILFIDLSRTRIDEVEVDDYLHTRFLGGKGFCTYFIYKYAQPCADPYGPRNVAVIAAGALAGYAPASGKTCFGAVSPLTGLIHDSYAGEVLGPKLRMAGYDAIVITGKSEEPVYIYVTEEGTEILSADDIWGHSTSKATKVLKERHGKKSSVAVVGPAAENKVRYASVIVDYHRAAGRGGIGAIWASKGLKAVVVKAAKPLPEPALGRKAWREVATKLYKKFQALGSSFSRYGTNNGLVTADKLGMAPHYNFKYPHLGDVGELKGENVVKLAKGPHEVEDQSVFGYMCPIKCSKVVKDEGIKSEYEHLGMLGAADGIYKLMDVLKAIKIVNDLGLDSISSGNVIGWTAESEEKGLLNGVMKWGDGEKQRKLLEEIAYRKGIGAVLAEGVKRASEILGFGKEWAVHVKGLEAPAWDPRGLLGFGLSYATADVGASHLRGWPRPHRPPTDSALKALDSLLYDRDKTSVADHMGTCVFLAYDFPDWSELLKVVYGLDYDTEELRKLSQRTESLARLWALKVGYTSDDDTVPPRWMEPVPKGPNAGLKAFISWEDLEVSKREYYKRRGWSPREGVPLPSTLKSLDLHFAVEDAELLLRKLEPEYY
ncbi:aldehyde ferredoxin oxidoreductase family protein [Ignicoccus hospitalis]|uniref:Aldehyde ferredoxin oxidoreductase n=1 Tax=Ignicoccus hospitalis (strain KIN4/I / DSM 18386 / JCM 14125) TaxID=453591 RepID=A8A8F7_IGNH4|nr:aldehyde ferredoxin oxidoreductase family protein [Ignicoccus hospitalis]ABU81209.1 Aldehyde ferredoxin oxidoreductase [Ignicoccus hospitalis KIN4/I]HIH90639.1 aldehyde ferredoxin oxidoreductase family protein [Desulfurococcaceae archaeon]